MRRGKEINVIDNVVTELTRWITGGEYTVGDKLPTEKELCQKLGVSRSTLREAISVVRAKGYIETRHGSGSYVVSTTAREEETVEQWFALRKSQLNDFFEVRCNIESMNIQYAIMRRSEKDIEGIRRIHNAFENAIMRGDAEKMAALDEKFHMELAKITDNSLLVEMNRIIAVALRPYRKKSFAIADNAIHALEPHNKIIKAIEDRDLSGGVQAVREHVDKSLEDIAAVAEKISEPADPEDLAD